MTPRIRMVCVRWAVAAAFLVCLYHAGQGALLLHLMNDAGGVDVFKPADAELVNRQAAPFQANTADTDGLFNIVQQQHRDLQLMFSRLETAETMNRWLVQAGTAVFSLLSLCLGVCLALLVSTPLPGQGRHPDKAPPKNG